MNIYNVNGKKRRYAFSLTLISSMKHSYEITDVSALEV
jgi:hypothetical protein